MQIPTPVCSPRLCILIGAYLVLAGAFVAPLRSATGEPPPNILFLLTDDQTWEALGCTGGEVKTPNMDRLAARGMLFTHGYNMGSWVGAVCVASRTMFNTGRTLWHCRDLELAELAYRKAGPTAPKPAPGTAWSQ